MAARTLTGASGQGDLQLVKKFIAEGVNVNETRPSGFFPLGGAAEKGRARVIRYLLDHGANIEKKTKYGWTPLFIATWRGYRHAVRVLIERGANIDVRVLPGWETNGKVTPLHVACDDGHFAIARDLLTAGAEPNPRDSAGSTPMDYALRYPKSRIIKLLAFYGGKANHPKDARLFNAMR